jgi:hypothetical protein
MRDVMGDGTPTAAERLASFRWGGTFVRYGAVVVIASLRKNLHGIPVAQVSVIPPHRLAPHLRARTA